MEPDKLKETTLSAMLRAAVVTVVKMFQAALRAIELAVTGMLRSHGMLIDWVTASIEFPRQTA